MAQLRDHLPAGHHGIDGDLAHYHLYHIRVMWASSDRLVLYNVAGQRYEGAPQPPRETSVNFDTHGLYVLYFI